MRRKFTKGISGWLALSLSLSLSWPPASPSILWAPFKLSAPSSLNDLRQVPQKLKEISRNLHPLLGLPALRLLEKWEKAQGDAHRLDADFWNDYQTLLKEYDRIQNAPSGWVYDLYPELRRTAGQGTVLSLTADLMLEHPELIGLGTGGLGVLKRDDTIAFGEALGPDNYFLCAPFYRKKSHQEINPDGTQKWVFYDVDKQKVPVTPRPQLIRIRYGEGEGDHAPPTQRWIYMRVWAGKLGKGNLLLLDPDVPENEDVDLYDDQGKARPEVGWNRFINPERAKKHYQRMKDAKNGFQYDPRHDRDIMERIYPKDKKGEDSQRQRFKQFVLLSLGSFEAFKLANQRRGIEAPTFLHLNDPHTAPAAAKVLVDPAYQNVLAVYTNHTLVEGAGTQFFHPATNGERVYNPWFDPFFFLPFNDDSRVRAAFNHSGNVEFSRAAELLVARLIRFGRVNAVNSDEHAPKLAAQPQKNGLYRLGENLVGVDNGVDPNWAPPEFRFPWEGMTPAEFEAAAREFALKLDEATIEKVKRRAKEELNAYLQRRYGKSIDPNKMLVVYAKRFNAYKRPTLIMDIVEEIEKKLQDRGSDEEIQIIFSGKANDNDGEGIELVKKIVQLEKEYQTRPGRIKVLYLPDYHIELAKKLLAASDFWLNTPQRHREASGTSLLKAAINGSILISTQSGAACHEAFFRHGENALLVDVDEGRTDAAGRKIKTIYEKHFLDPDVEKMEKEQLGNLMARAHDLFYRPDQRPKLNQMRRAGIAKIWEVSSERQVRDQIVKTFMPLVFKRDFAPLSRENLVRWDMRIDPLSGKPRVDVEVNLGKIDPQKIDVGIRYWDRSVRGPNWESPDGRWDEFVLKLTGPVEGKPGHYHYRGYPDLDLSGGVQYVAWIEHAQNHSLYAKEFNFDPWVETVRQRGWSHAWRSWEVFHEPDGMAIGVLGISDRVEVSL